MTAHRSTSTTHTALSAEALKLLEQADIIAALKSSLHGIEKESLRVAKHNGQLSNTKHPAALGSTLTHPNITTDYSEALMEIITEPHTTAAAALEQLSSLHQWVYHIIEQHNETLWPASMPCFVGGEDDIRIAEYGDSNVGRMKYIYRVGLGHRYSRLMQTISGIHYNYSLSDDFWNAYANFQDAKNNQDTLRDTKDARYLAMIRNFRRYTWLLVYLFGASPAVCSSFVKNKTHSLDSLTDKTLYAPQGTSLRMGGLGYQSDAQANMYVCYNTLNDYISTLLPALTEQHSDYEAIGLKKDGEYQQLSTALLQIENEFYSSIRPKQPIKSGEAPAHALQERGIAYVEVRCLDVNPLLPLGMDVQQLQFVETFLLYCLLQDSPNLSPEENSVNDNNLLNVVNHGRQPNVQLQNRENNSISMNTWATELLDAMQPIAKALDSAHNTTDYSESLQKQQAKVNNATLTPSATILDEINQNNEEYHQYTLRLSQRHHQYFAEKELTNSERREHAALSEQSRKAFVEAQQTNEIPFDRYMLNYYQQYESVIAKLQPIAEPC